MVEYKNTEQEVLGFDTKPCSAERKPLLSSHSTGFLTGNGDRLLMTGHASEPKNTPNGELK